MKLHLLYAHHSSSCKTFPSEYDLLHKMKFEGENGTIDTSLVHEFLGSPTAPAEVNYGRLFDLVHALNYLRKTLILDSVFFDDYPEFSALF